MQNNKKGLFITFEGIEKCGKTTQSKLLYDKLLSLGEKVVYLKDPGVTEVGENFRNALLYGKNISVETEVLLFLACRAQLVNEHIFPALKDDKIVICDRFSDSTFAYQGYGRNVNLSFLKSLDKFATKGIKPDITFLFDFSFFEAKQRFLDSKDRMETESIEFHNRVRAGYLDLASMEPDRFCILYSKLNIEKLHEIVLKKVLERKNERRCSRKD
ncbi:Thymidylate kinase [Thermodesulfobium narugense DSM 14796]|uniref:Thymidylate kinase n=1 Tax=Thermodesulfobium narugense DSM 14796 TaxID=747365 RepID=M1E8C2_9BACT|nr:dTMP kinase [Thermodesulfobium narugense]AEE14389.1 Thymidylate kinase [Thermodesulfobium narugense DSM 14796]